MVTRLKPGELFTHEFSVEPVSNGGFILKVTTGSDTYAFTCLADLLRFLEDESDHLDDNHRTLLVETKGI